LADLTERQRQVVELRESQTPPLSFDEIAERLEISRETVRRYYQEAKGDDAVTVGYRRIESRDPEKAVDYIDKWTDPFRRIWQAVEESGLPKQTAHQLMKRLERDYSTVVMEVERVKTEVLVRQFEHLAQDALKAITQKKLDDTSAYQLALIAAIATDKRELLDGRPTERISVEDRRALPDLMKAMLFEARRRGLMPQTNPETGRTILADCPEADIDVRSGNQRMELIETGLD